ncbi:MAG: ATP synthase F0 subunit B [Clostridia bacterium]|jgi:F-type H+-transporting ATPase subunit b|nr:ATP synthase F0 subunit B [Clostridia bacterium]
MPLNIDFVQVLLHMLNFVILAGGLALILFHPIKKFMTERQKQFEDREEANRKQAEENARLQAELEEKAAAFEAEMAETRLKTEQEAADAAKAYIESSKTEAAAIVAKAEKEAEKRKEQILDSAQTEIGELVIGAAQKLLGDTATPEQTQALYDAFLKQAEQAQANAAKQKEKRA